MKVVRQKLNDANRMGLWQEGIENFDLSRVTEPSASLRDYLEYYGLKATRPGIKYYGGFVQQQGFRVFRQLFLQEKEAELVLVVHGYTDHAGIFSRVINYLLDTGRSVAIFDQPGHGLSSGERATIADFGIYLDILSAEARFFSEQGFGPLNIIAQSLGGGLVMDWILSQRTGADALGVVILLAPLVRPKAWQKALWTSRLFGRVISSVPRGYSRNSEDEAFTRFVRYEDPVQHDRLPAQWVKAMIDWVRKFEELSGDETRLWVVQGDDDQTVDWQYNLEHIARKFPNTEIRTVPGGGHHLAGESKRLQQFLFNYIEEAFAEKQAKKNQP